MCYGSIKWAKIKNIGFDDNLIYDDIINKTQNMKRIDNDDAIKAFQLWTKTTNKIFNN